jgi:hypothetical protein
LSVDQPTVGATGGAAKSSAPDNSIVRLDATPFIASLRPPEHF